MLLKSPVLSYVMTSHGAPRWSCYLTPATPATPASNIRGTATDNLPLKNRLAKVCRISTEFTKIARRICKLAYTRRIFSFLPKNSENPSYATVVSAVHLFSNTYPTPCLPLAGFESYSINAGNNVGGSYDV